MSEEKGKSSEAQSLQEAKEQDLLRAERFRTVQTTIFGKNLRRVDNVYYANQIQELANDKGGLLTRNHGLSYPGAIQVYSPGTWHGKGAANPSCPVVVSRYTPYNHLTPDDMIKEITDRITDAARRVVGEDVKVEFIEDEEFIKRKRKEYERSKSETPQDSTQSHDTIRFNPEPFKKVLAYAENRGALSFLIREFQKPKPEKRTIIYGPPGVGKTTLLEAMGQALSNTRYLDLEQLCTDISHAHRSQQNIRTLTEKYTNTRGLLLVDNVNGITNPEGVPRPGTQNLLYAILKVRDAKKLPVVLATSQGVPYLLEKTKSPDLQSLWKRAVFLQIQSPTRGTRRAIITELCDRASFTPTNRRDIVSLLDSTLPERYPIGEMQSAIQTLGGNWYGNQQVPVEEASILLKDAGHQPEQKPLPPLSPLSPSGIMKKALAYLDPHETCTVEQIIGPSRDAQTCKLRAGLMYALRNAGAAGEGRKRSFAEVGKLVGKRTHSTAMHGVKTAEKSFSPAQLEGILAEARAQP